MATTPTGDSQRRVSLPSRAVVQPGRSSTAIRYPWQSWSNPSHRTGGEPPDKRIIHTTHQLMHSTVPAFHERSHGRGRAIGQKGSSCSFSTTFKLGSGFHAILFRLLTGDRQTLS
jgi:hypothetical protein